MSYADKTRRPPKTLTDREVKKILKVMGESKAGFRDRVIVSLALGCGLRESEIAALDVLDVAPDGLKPRRIIQLRTFKRAGKAPDLDAQRVHVPDATWYLLEKYLRAEWRNQRPSEGTALFPTRQSARITTRQIRGLWREWQRRAGFDHLYNFHTLRHTAITNVRRIAKDIRIAQKFARHVNIATTVRYEHASDEEVAAAVKDVAA